MTDAILRDDPASTQQPSPSKSLLTRCRDVIAGLKDLCSRKQQFVGIPLDTELPRISPDLVNRIIQLDRFNEKLVEGPSYKAKLAHDLDRDIRAAIGPELLEEYAQLRQLEKEGRPPDGRLQYAFKIAAEYLRGELVKGFETVKAGNKPLGWGLNDVIYSKEAGPEADLRRLAVNLSLMEAYSTAGRCFNHWRNAGAEYLEAQRASAKVTERSPS